MNCSCLLSETLNKSNKIRQLTVDPLLSGEDQDKRERQVSADLETANIYSY